MKYFLSIAMGSILGLVIGSYLIQGIGGIQQGDEDISNQVVLVFTVVGGGVGFVYATKI